ncbi:MAG: TIGR03088 family PEP-CTERM/XrtA system glycosyltransferase [Nitrococcus mobilis]|nr:TIGR03088 family PEP-CTERM/XrtA system glycosyltransferase [Nitrococcus mobilis]
MNEPLLCSRDQRPLVVHVVHRLDIGGLENGVVNLINRLPPETFDHCVLSLTEVTEFRRRIERPDVDCLALHKKPGKDPVLYMKLWRTFRALQPAIVHTRNLATLEAQLPALLAGVPVRIHGEHGWEADDVAARSRKNQWLRRAMRSLTHRYVAVSQHISEYLQRRINVPATRISQIYNGVDTTRFRPGSDRAWVTERFGLADAFVIGTVERLQAVKDPLNLARAFLQLLRSQPSVAARARLVVVGAGPLQDALESVLQAGGVRHLCWLAGNRADIPALLRGFDLFVLPSLAEGISNTILEAMASGLPVAATAVGGNPELVEEGVTGCLVPPADPLALADAMRVYLENPGLAKAHGLAGRRRAEERFSLDTMIDAYAELYTSLLEQRGIDCRNAGFPVSTPPRPR